MASFEPATRQRTADVSGADDRDRSRACARLAPRAIALGTPRDRKPDLTAVPPLQGELDPQHRQGLELACATEPGQRDDFETEIRAEPRGHRHSLGVVPRP